MRQQGEEGIFDVPEEEYHKSEGVSKSALDHMDQSPQHYEYAINHPTDPTPSMKFGSLFHCMTLEPHRVDEDYSVSPVCDKRTKAGKAKYAKFLLESEGKTPVSQDDMFKSIQMVKSLGNHQLASTLMCQTGVNEKSIYSIDPDLNILKRGRLDKMCENAKMIIDAKSTSDASPKAFTRSIFNYNYHVQGAYYIDLAREQGVDIERFVFIAVEKEAPFSVAVYELDDGAIEVGRSTYKKNLARVSACRDGDVWPSYSNEQAWLVETPSWI